MNCADVPNNKKPNIREYKNIFDGRLPVAVIGSGPSVIDSIKKLPENCFTIAVNMRPLELPIKFDMVFSKDREVGTQIKYNFKKYDIIRASYITDLSDFWMHSDDVHNISYSGIVATGLALYLGGNPVILCGMDLYRKMPYFNSQVGEEHHPGRNKPLKEHLGDWGQVFYRYDNPERIKVIDSPLSKLFKEYK